MRTVILWRLTAILLLVSGTLAVPLSNTPIANVAAQDQGKNDKEKEKEEEKEEKREEKQRKKEEKEREKDERKDSAEISRTEGYVVELECDYDANAGSTTCVFTGTAPDGAKDVGHVDLPADEVCAEVIGGEHEYVDPDPNTRVTGYKSRGAEGTFTLVLEGEVAPAGTATYWFKTGDGVFPATGPGLGCGEDLAEFTLQLSPEAEEATEGKADETDETGDLLVLIYLCAGVPEDTSAYDWFGECDPEGGVHDFTVTKVSETQSAPITMESNASGDVTFHDLEPGLYSLKMTDATWCHAASDNVNADGNVTIAAGERTTVWGFICQ